MNFASEMRQAIVEMFCNVCRLLYSAKISYYEVAYLYIVCAIVMRVKFPLAEVIGRNTKDRSCLDLLALDTAFLHITVFIDKIVDQLNYATGHDSTLHYLKVFDFYAKGSCFEIRKK